jgi:hypothetical protein
LTAALFLNRGQRGAYIDCFGDPPILKGEVMIDPSDCGSLSAR